MSEQRPAGPGAARAMLRFLGARRATAYLLLGYAVFLSFLAIWGTNIPAPVVQSISTLAPFWLAYAVAFVHLGACCILFWPALRQRVSLSPPPGEPGVPLPALDPTALAAGARRAGFRVHRLAEGHGAVLHRFRYSPAGTLLFHAALLLLPLAFLLSRATRFRGDAWIVEGRSFGGTQAEYVRFEPAGSFAERAPEVSFRVEAIEASFWGDRLLFTDLRALLAIDGDAGFATLSAPLWLDGARVTLHGFNYTPTFELRGPGGELADGGELDLQLFPPGTEDSFAIPGLPHRFFVRLYPSATGNALERPRFHLAVTRGKRLVAHGFLRPGEPLAFDGRRLSFPGIRRGAEIQVHRDDGYPLLWAALICALLGTVARILFPQVRIWVRLGPEGATAVVREDAFATGRAAALLRSWGAP